MRWDDRCPTCTLSGHECVCPSAQQERDRVVGLATKTLDSIQQIDLPASEKARAVREVVGLVYTAGVTHTLHTLQPKLAAVEDALAVRVPCEQSR